MFYRVRSKDWFHIEASYDGWLFLNHNLPRTRYRKAFWHNLRIHYRFYLTKVIDRLSLLTAPFSKYLSGKRKHLKYRIADYIVRQFLYEALEYADIDMFRENLVLYKQELEGKNQHAYSRRH